MKGPLAGKIVLYRSLQAAMEAGLGARQAVAVIEESCAPAPWFSWSVLFFRLLELWGAPRAPGFAVSQATLRDIAGRVGEGGSFADAFAAHPDEFPAWEIALVRVAEKTGRADQLFGHNAHILEQQLAALQARVAAAAQPTLTLLLAPWIVVVPLLYLWGWPAYLAAVVVAYLLFTPAGALLRPRQGKPADPNDAPGFAKMQFTGCLALLVKAGVCADEALELSALAAGRGAPSAAPGETLHARLSRCGMFSREDLAFVETGELSGKLDSALDYVARRAEQAWQTSLDRSKTGF